MPWDNSLNSNAKLLHDYHYVITAKLGDKDTSKYSMKTPKLIARGMKRLIENDWDEDIPSTEQLIRDCVFALNETYTVYQTGVSIVAELSNRNCDRYSKKGTGDHGGVIIKDNPGTN